MGRVSCFLKQKNATIKKRMLGKIPQSAPHAKSCMITGLPLFSKYTHTKTKAPVSGMTAMRPADDGNFFAIPVATKIMTRLITAFSKICINVFLRYGVTF